jgi:DNA-binding beta-propeller fold protein YncE
MDNFRQLLAFSLLPALAVVNWASGTLRMQTDHRNLMLVVSKGLPGIRLYDADTEQPICDAKMGVSPHEAAFSLDGKYAYVPVYGSSGVGQPGTDEHVLHVIRTSDCKEVGTLDTGENKRPHGIAVGRSGTVYLTAEIAQSVLLIDPEQRRIVAKIPTGSPYSHMLALTQDEKKIYVSNVQSKTVSVLDVPDRKLAHVIHTSAQNQRMTLSPDERWFVTNLGPEHKIAFFRTADNQLDFAVMVDGDPFVSKFSADGKYLYNAGHQQGRIRAWKIDVAQRKVIATTDGDLGSNAGALAVNPFNKEVYVSDQETDKISEIDPETWKVKKQLPADKTPDAMAFVTVR